MLPTIYPRPRMPDMSELVFAMLSLAVEGAIRLLRSTDEISETDRATLARAAELSAELLERQKFGNER
jgi:hypothetical protein